MEKELSEFFNRTYNVFIYEDWKNPLERSWIIKVKSELFYKVIDDKVIDDKVITFHSIAYAYEINDLSIIYSPKHWMYSFFDEFPEILL